MDKWKMVRLGEVLSYEQPTEYIVKSTNYSSAFKTPVLTAGQTFILGYTNEEDNIYKDLPVIIFDDFTTAIKYVDFPFKVKSSAMKILKVKDANIKYLFYYMSTIKTDTQLHKRYWISKYSNIKLSLPPLDIQKKIADVLDKVSSLIALRKDQINQLDLLIKSQFVEMFGDLAHNNLSFPTMQMTELCQIIDGDRGKNYPKQEDFSGTGFCLFLNAKNVTNNGFSFDSCMYITEEKDGLLRNGRLCRGDIVLTTRGTLGNLAFYDDSVPFDHIRINSGMVILRMKRDMINEVFFIEQFRMKLTAIKESIASGSAQPQLPISTMNQIKIVVPPLSLQNEFAAFVKQVEAQKKLLQQSLEKMELNYKSLMQKCFRGEIF